MKKLSSTEEQIYQKIAENKVNKNHRIQLQLRRELQRRQTADFYYLIDIVGTCNLKCPSCPVGNYEEQPSKGLMSLEDYRLILEKIRNEHHGEKLFIDLYNWGEPGIHKQLGEIIKLTHEFGYGVGISSNLNVFADMKSAVKEEPEYIRVSLSGYFNDAYQQTHRGGDINVVKANMHLLRYWIDKTKSNTIVQVGFHIYKNNFPKDFTKIRELCDDLGFIFAPTLAALMPVEKAVLVVDGKPLPGHEDLLNNLVVSTSERAELLAKARNLYSDCQYRKKRTTINFDGSVPLCCATFENDQIIASNFLNVSRNELMERKYAHSFCKKCQFRSLDMVYTGAESHLVEAEAVNRLGQAYSDFLDEWNVPLDPIIVWNGEELSVQLAYEKAIEYRNLGEIYSAKLLLAELLLEVPGHGEALFQLGYLHELEGNFSDAFTIYKNALDLLPGHPPYLAAFLKIKEMIKS